eukprot:GHVQ01002623.1.p1 GENE.GHVQ01002623.1~~GHVQ01002623.1.p1  ORF type:complete len:933 (+),score=126.79 GHVQ01002623.1:131-2929(+)
MEDSDERHNGVPLREIGDVTKSVAFGYLEEAHLQGRLSHDKVNSYKQKLTKLQDKVLKTLENETRCLKAVKKLNEQVMAERIRLDDVESRRAECASENKKLRLQLKQTDTDMEQFAEREAILELQQAECQQEKVELQEFLDERERSEREAQQPLIDNAQSELDMIKKEISSYQLSIDRRKTQIAQLNQRLQDGEAAIESLTIVKDAVTRDLRKVSSDPERIRRRTEKFEGVSKSLTDQLQIASTEIESSCLSHAGLVESRKLLEESVQAKDLQLKWDRDQLQGKDQSRRELVAKHDNEKAEYLQALETKRSRELDLRAILTDIRLTQDEMCQRQKIFDRLKRDYKKKEAIRDFCRQSISPQIQSKVEALKDLKRMEEDISKQKSLLQEVHTEVELFIGAFLKEESLEKDKRDEYEGIHRHIEDMQTQLQTLKKQDLVWHKHASFLSSQREKMARERGLAARTARETQEQVNTKQLEDNDLRKKQLELMQQQKEYSTLYETVKNERNKYVAQIQSCEQQLAEMKERHKILSNELDILKMESMGKDRHLTRTHLDTLKLVEERDSLRTQSATIAGKGNNLNAQVEQFVLEIDKLNGIINVIEKEMVQLKRSYETAVEARNYTGIQLIDRNDELCVLWEKSNMQEKLLRKGQDAMLQKDEQLRIQKIQLEETARQLYAQQKLIPQVPKLVKEALELKQQLVEERNRAETLSQEFEKPSSGTLKLELPGENPDSETIHARLQILEDRLNVKKEALLEKELVLEEITTFSEKLRQKVLQGREGTLHLSDKVNLFQTKLQAITTRMMATISELSLYQATSLKMESIRNEKQQQIDDARNNMLEGRPPTPNAGHEFDKMIQQEKQRKSDREASRMLKNGEALLASNVTRTTSEPRVNSYIPEGSVGIPKAYGAHAPFMPAQSGATMRYIKKPNPRPIEI